MPQESELTRQTESRPLKVAMVAACPLPAERGTPSRILRMAEALAKRGHELHIVTYHLGTAIEPNGLSVHRIPNIPTYRRYSPGPTYQKLLLVDPVLCMTLVKVIRRHKIDLIHAHHFEGALVAYGARMLTRRKVIYDAHTTLDGELHHYPFWFPKRMAKYLDGAVPRAADHVIAVSEDIRDYLENRGSRPELMSVVPTGVNLEDFDTAKSGDFRSRLGIGEGPVLIYTGGLAAFQGVSYLLLAMKKVIEQEPSAQLLIVSADTDVKSLETEASAMGIAGHTKFLTGIPFTEVVDYLAAADIAAIPRVGCPGVPQKLGNYMAAALPIVSFRGAAKLIEHDVSGLIVPDGDVDAFAASVVRLIRNRQLARKLGDSARDAIFTNYGWPPLARQIEEVYMTLVDRGGAGA